MRGTKLPNQSEGRNVNEQVHHSKKILSTSFNMQSSPSLASSIRPFSYIYASKAQNHQLELRFFKMPHLHTHKTGQESIHPCQRKHEHKDQTASFRYLWH